MKNVYSALCPLFFIGIMGCADLDTETSSFCDEISESNVRITVNIENNSTRTTWQEGETSVIVSWEEGDELLLTNRSGSLQGMFNIHLDDDGLALLCPKDKSFIIDDFANEDIYAFYYDGYSYSISNDEISFYTSYNYKKIRDILWGVGEITEDGVHFKMKHLCPILKVRVPAETFEKTVFSNLNLTPSFNMNTNTYVNRVDDVNLGYMYSDYEALRDNEDLILYCIPTKNTELHSIRDDQDYDDWDYSIEFPNVDPMPGIMYEYDLSARLREREIDKTYQSTDFSEDGQVVQLQQATVGKGIDLVFIGYGYVDKHMNPDGKYERRIKLEVERFFDIEPYKTFRNRFNVYMVKVVSKTCHWEGGWGSDNNLSLDVAFSYANKVPGLDIARVSVVHNNDFNKYARSYCVWTSDGSFVAYLFEDDPKIIQHEAGGHGFALLDDEYVESTNLEKVFTDYQGLDYQHSLGRSLNIDYNSSPSEVLWSHFLHDNRYDGESLGIYEGAWQAGHGLYRPTENSIMRFPVENAVYNAPSREQIYKQIMRFSEGDDWVYDYETFVEYDVVNRNYNNTGTRSRQNYQNILYDIKMKDNHRAPIFMEVLWRDYLK